MLTKVGIMIVSIFGTVLRELRENKKLYQEKLVGFCDLDRTYISLLERGLSLVITYSKTPLICQVNCFHDVYTSIKKELQNL